MFKFKGTIKQKATFGKGVKGIASLLPGKNNVAVGFPKGEADSDIIQRAIHNEFGTRGSGKGFSTPRGGGFGGPIPERPFMRNAMRNNQKKYQAGMRREARRIILAAVKGEDVAVEKLTTLRKLGILAQGDIQEEITSLASPPNSPVTIALKGSSNPLIDSGEMRGAVTYRIED